jgi:hypothetical protein
MPVRPAIFELLETSVYVLSSALSPHVLANLCSSLGVPPQAINAFRWNDPKLAETNAVTLDVIYGAAHGAMPVELLRQEGASSAAKLMAVLADSPAARSERAGDAPAPGSYGARALDNASSAASYCDAAARIANVGKITLLCKEAFVLEHRLEFCM